MKTRIVDQNAVIDVPPQVAKCPYCGKRLHVSAYEWEQMQNCRWRAYSINLECEETPGGPFPSWGAFLDTHMHMPYVYWLPVEEKVKRWLQKHYRFILS